MEVSALRAPSIGAELDMDMNIEMDIDIDIDLGPPPMEAEQFLLRPSIHPISQNDEISPIPDIGHNNATLNKVHIRGLDDLTTDDLQTFSTHHFPANPPLKIEWIDDTSANFVFENQAIAFEALDSFTCTPNGGEPANSLQLRNAKSLDSNPALNLQVRMAVATDRKQPRAYETSRFYLMHPEHDPREARRNSRRRDGSGDYRRRRYGEDEQRRRKRGADKDGFSASMYDDDSNALEDREKRRPSGSSFSSGTNGGSFRGDSYRSNPPNRTRSRDRSASPQRENGDGTRRRERRRTPPPRYKSRDSNPFPRENMGKELFPARSMSHDISHELRGASGATAVKELFPNKNAAASLKKELFPFKVGTSVHRRSDAFDAADETADLFASGMSVPFVDGALESDGRLRMSDPDPEPEALEDLQRGGFSIRGASKKQNLEFSIRGAAISSFAVKELFPGKAGNAGKELFADRLQGRGGRRNKAADMFL